MEKRPKDQVLMCGHGLLECTDTAPIAKITGTRGIISLTSCVTHCIASGTKAFHSLYKLLQCRHVLRQHQEP